MSLGAAKGRLWRDLCHPHIALKDNARGVNHGSIATETRRNGQLERGYGERATEATLSKYAEAKHTYRARSSPLTAFDREEDG